MIGIEIVVVLLYLFLALLVVRMVADWAQLLAQDWRPQGGTAAALEVVYSATDPPLRALRRVIPPLRLGSVSVDLGFMVLFIGVLILAQVLPSL